jgi:hypothetical protein
MADLRQLVKRATKALTLWATAGFPVVDEATLARQIEACLGAGKKRRRGQRAPSLFSCPLPYDRGWGRVIRGAGTGV